MFAKTTKRLSRALIVAGFAVVLAGLCLSGSASAMRFGGWQPFGGIPHGRWAPFHGRPSGVTLNGLWAPFGRCPVDNPAMLAANGSTTIALCLAVSSPSDSLKIGSSTIALGELDTQMGLISTVSESGQEYIPVSPPGGAVVGTSSQIPGGLQALVCPSSAWPLRELCGGHLPGWLNATTATVLSAGEPSHFNLTLAPGAPILTLPIEIYLENPLLGEGCTIGSSSEPIVLQPEYLGETKFGEVVFDGDGTLDPEGTMAEFTITGSAIGDSTIAIPGASGCGFRGQLDSAIDGHVGLPSPSGSNDLVENETAAYLAGLGVRGENDGQVLSSNWHSAVLGGWHGH
jgi:hypothetical protein